MIDRLNAALSGRYRIEELVGRGGMAAVYRATDLRHERVVAIKVMNAEFAETVGRERFLREIRVTAGLTHPHILPLYDSGDVDGTLFYVMPFIEGESLRQRLAGGTPLPLAEVEKIAREVASALAYAGQRGLVHRDIKPENILLAGYSSGAPANTWNTVVADFGIAMPTDTRGDHLTITGIVVGSPHYMSPEQAMGAPIDQRSDIWSLGCVLHEMLEGMPPRGTPVLRRKDTPAALRLVVRRGLAVDPDQRFRDAREMLEAIDRSAPHAARRGIRLLAWGATIAAVALAVAVTSATRRHSTPAASRLTRDTLALALYNRGRENVKVRTLTSAAEAFSQFSRAIERDSGFALAWSGLARSAQLAVLIGAPIPGRSRDSLVAVALAAAQRAVTLDSTSSEVWLVRARVMESVEPTSRTAVLNDLRRALAADSMNGEAWLLLARARDELLDTTGARVAYERAVKLAPMNPEVLGFFALHYHYANQPQPGIRWADSALAVDPTYWLARDAEVVLAMETGDLRLAEQNLLALQQVVRGRDRVTPLVRSSQLAALRGDLNGARAFAREAEQLVDSASLSKHESLFLAGAFAAAGDTARAYHWLALYSPRNDVHFQLHLQRERELAWVHDERFRGLLAP
jgi:serine/threonine-protein kinase